MDWPGWQVGTLGRGDALTMLVEPADIEAAAARLAGGGLVAFPTETVYGLGADATNAEAVARVFKAKGRPAANPLIVHASDAAMAETCAAAWPEIASKAASAFWPGPLTLVLKRAESIPDVVTGGGPTVAVRVPDHPVAIALIEAFGKPIVGPSANPSGYVSPTLADHVTSHFSGDEVLVLDGGPCRAGIESTVLDVSGETPTILRRGVLGVEDLAPVLGEVRVADARVEAGQSPASPGMLGPHYRPKAPVQLLEDVTELSRVVAEAGGRVTLLSPPGRRVVVSEPHVGIDMPGLASGYACRLYAALREADAESPEKIIVVLPLLQDSEVWEAVRERLRRAASQ